MTDEQTLRQMALVALNKAQEVSPKGEAAALDNTELWDLIGAIGEEWVDEDTGLIPGVNEDARELIEAIENSVYEGNAFAVKVQLIALYRDLTQLECDDLNAQSEMLREEANDLEVVAEGLTDQLSAIEDSA